MSEAEQCPGSSTLPSEYDTAPGGKTVGRCKDCGAWVYVTTAATLKAHKLVRGEQAPK